MEFSSLRKKMLRAATSEMTTKPKNRKMLLEDIGDGCLLTVEDDQGCSIMFNSDGSIEDIDYDFEEATEEDIISRVKGDPETISLYFAYSFGGGHPVFIREGDSFVQASPQKTIETWRDAFVNGNNDGWERKVIAKLSKLDPRFPYAWIDYDSDFGYQGVILYISKTNPEAPEED